MPRELWGLLLNFKMGFNRDDCLTTEGSVTCLWVANCCRLIRTRDASSCCVKECKTFALLERSASEAQCSGSTCSSVECVAPETAFGHSFCLLEGRGDTSFYPLQKSWEEWSVRKWALFRRLSRGFQILRRHPCKLLPGRKEERKQSCI